MEVEAKIQKLLVEMQADTPTVELQLADAVRSALAIGVDKALEDLAQKRAAVEEARARP